MAARSSVRVEARLAYYGCSRAASTGPLHRPYLSTWARESALLRQWGVPTYGLLPFPLNPDDEGGMHRHDERVPLAALELGSRLVLDILTRIAT